MTLLEQRALWPLVEARAEATPEALFAVDEAERTLSFAAYRDACLRAAAGLAGLGIGEGTPVSWQLPTRLEAMVLVGALARLGAVQNPILPFLREREVGFMTRQTGARFLFVPARFRGFDYAAMAQGLRAEAQGLQVVVIADALPEGSPGSLPPLPENDPAAVRWIFYSSGTTADPKGARHTDASVAAPGMAMCRVLALRPQDRNAFVFPFTHVGGIGWLFAGLMAGFAHIVVEVFHLQRSIGFLAEHGVTIAGAGTVFHQAYLAAQQQAGREPIFPQVRAFPGGGAPKPPQLFHDLLAATGAPIVSGYGLTEYPVAVMGCLDDPPEKLALTEGRATPGTQLRLVTREGAPVAPGEEGEVCVRGPHLCQGYVDPTLDQAAFDGEGFFHTGDLGRLDAEGYLRITGRLKDVIIRKGENVSAGELEEHLYEHPKVADVAVIGLPDAARGERVCAVVVCSDAADPLRFEELAPFLEARGLARQKVPEQLELVPELPRNASGKVLKHVLRSRFEGLE